MEPTPLQLAAELAEVKKQLQALTELFEDHVHMYKGHQNYKHATGKPRSWKLGQQQDDHNSDW